MKSDDGVMRGGGMRKGIRTSDSDVANPLFRFLSEKYGLDTITSEISDVGVRDDSHKVFMKYTQAMWRHLCAGYDDDTNTCEISMMTARKDCGRIGPRGQQKYVMDIMKVFPWYTELQKGYNIAGKRKSLTKVKPVMNMQEYSKEVMDTNVSNYCDAVEAHRAMNGDIDWVPVHTFNLENYINSTEATLNGMPSDDEQKDNYRKTLTRGLKQARLFLAVSKRYSGMLPQMVSDKPCPRRYYIRANLQIASKPVRDAVLGPHTEIDLDNCVLAAKINLLYSAAKQQGMDITATEFAYTYFPHSFQYLEGKRQQRKHIRNLLVKGFHSVYPDWTVYKDTYADEAKQILTLVGFGSNVNSVGYPTKTGFHTTAITDVLNPRDEQGKDKRYLRKVVDAQLILLKSDEWFRNYVREHKEMNKALLAYQPYVDMIPDDVKGPSSRVSYLYQSMETQIMDMVVDTLKSRGHSILVRVHDAVYVRNRPGAETLRDIKYMVREFMPISGSISVEDHELLYNNLDEELRSMLHKQNMKTEDSDTEEYVSQMAQVSNKAVVEKMKAIQEWYEQAGHPDEVCGKEFFDGSGYGGGGYDYGKRYDADLDPHWDPEGYERYR